MVWELEDEPGLPEKVEQGIPMTLDQAKAAIDKVKIDLQVYADKIREMKTEVQLLTVDDDQSLELCVDLGIRSKNLSKEINTERDRILLSPGEFIKAVKNFAKQYTDVLDSIEDITKAKKKSYGILRDQRMKEAQKKLDEETQKLREKVQEEARQAGVAAVDVPTPILGKEKKTVRTASGTAYTSEYWKFTTGPIHRNAPTYPGVGKPRVIVYGAFNKDGIVYAGEKAGLTGASLERFKSALNEVKLELEINEDGQTAIVSVDGKLLPIIPAQFLMANDKEIRKAVDGGERNIQGVEVFREDKEVYR